MRITSSPSGAFKLSGTSGRSDANPNPTRTAVAPMTWIIVFIVILLRRECEITIRLDKQHTNVAELHGPKARRQIRQQATLATGNPNFQRLPNLTRSQAGRN